MTLSALDEYFRSFLEIEKFENVDPSLNGIQVANDGSDIECVAFAVDACKETIERAQSEGAGMLFTHHGFFWGQPIALTGSHYRRVAALLKYNIALYACHLPLDANKTTGNNYGLARKLGLADLEPFGTWHGLTIGVKGEFKQTAEMDYLINSLFQGNTAKTILPFGPRKIKKVAIISGSGGDDTEKAIEAGADVYITGEVSHEVYHLAQENHISVIAGGHYETETVGVQLVAEKLAKESGLRTVFIDVPTGL